MQRVWQLLGSIVSEGGGPGGAAGGRRAAALVRGARQHLQQGHAAYLRNIILAHRTQVRSSPPPLCAPCILHVSADLVPGQAFCMADLVLHWMHRAI